MAGEHDLHAPRFGIEVLSVALNPADRVWTPLMKGPSTRYRFPTEHDAELFALQLLDTQPRLELRIVPLSGAPLAPTAEAPRPGPTTGLLDQYLASGT